MQVILIAGSDRDLLRTRATVLSLASSRVVRALPNHIDDLIPAVLSRRDPAVVVICHTMASQHPRLCRQIHAVATLTRIILLQEIETPQQSEDARCVLLPFGVKPDLLLKTVQQALHQQAS